MAATTKTLTPTNQTISIPAFTDKPDNRLQTDSTSKLADAVNALNSKMANHLEIKYISATDTSSVKNGIISCCSIFATLVNDSGFYTVRFYVAGVINLIGWVIKNDSEYTGFLEEDGDCYSFTYKPQYSIETVYHITSTIL